MTILVMDSDPGTLEQITSILKKNEFHTLSVRSVNQAVAQLQSRLSISMIFAEISMSEDDGFELLRFLRDNLRFSQIPVIVCATVADSKSVVRSVALGAKDYIVKPIRPEVLLSKVNKALEASIETVLVVEDNELLRGLLAKTLEREGYKVLTASSANEALQLMQNNKVTVILSDIKMPEMSGLELLVAVKGKYPDVPVLLMTGYAGEYSKVDILTAGADGYITKPFHNTDIIKRIAVAKRGKRTKVTKRTIIARKLINLEMSSKEEQ